MGPHTDKYVIFINLKNFSLKNNPALNTTKETIKMLCDCFPEHLGHLICYQAPWVFKPIFEAVKVFIDPKTVSKVHFVQGDESEGGEMDRLMKTIIGDDWRALTGAGQPVLSEGSSPGFDFLVYWTGLMKRVRALQSKEGADGGVSLAGLTLDEKLGSAPGSGSGSGTGSGTGLGLGLGSGLESGSAVPESVFTTAAATATSATTELDK
jgi:hypothetical protein